MLDRVSGPQILKLDNDLRLVLDPMEGLRTFALTVIIHGGARFEADHQSGWAHLLEHMVFKGAGGRNARALAEAIEARGGTINASTGYEHTRFEVRGMTELLPMALTIVADMMYRPHIDPDELVREKKVVEQEILEAYDTPDDHVFDMLQGVMFQNQVLGRPILGTKESLIPVDHVALGTFAQGLYAPQNVVVCISGGFDQAMVVDLVGNSFGNVTKCHSAAIVAPAFFKGGERRDVRKIEQANITFGFEGLNRFDDDLIALRLFSEILGGGMASRLFQEAREDRGLAYTIDAFVTPYRETGVFGIYAGCAPEDVKPLTALIFDVMGALSETCREDELSRAKAQYLTSLCLGHEGAGARAGIYASQVSTYGRCFSMDELSARIEGVGVDDLKRLGQKLSASSHHARALLGPKSATV